MTDSTTRFSNRAGDYARYRPSYPREIIASLVEGFDRAVVADLGAGTGISSVLLADVADRVYAVEPNAAMRAQVPERTNITAVNGTAEATTLADASVDVVAAFQAYHWFDPARVFPEAARIGREHARFAAVWNERDDDDPFMREYKAIITPYMDDATESKRRRSTIDGDLREHGWHNVRTVSLRHQMTADWEQLIGRTRSASYLPREGPAYESLAAELRSLFDRADRYGGARFVMVATAHLGDRQ